MRTTLWVRASAVAITLLFVVSGISAMAQDDQSVAAAASASRKSAASAHKVYGDDDVSALRHKDHVPDSLAAVCDAACQAKVKDVLQQEAPGNWQSHFDEAMTATKEDDEWQELFARVRAQNCADKHTGKSPEASNPALLTDLRAKIAEERQEMITLRREAMAMPPNSPDLEGKLNLIRVRAVKLVIMGVELTGLSSDPCTATAKTSNKSTAAQQAAAQQ